jgi:hypothetical protein
MQVRRLAGNAEVSFWYREKGGRVRFVVSMIDVNSNS